MLCYQKLVTVQSFLFVVMFSCGSLKKEKKLQRVEILKGNGLWRTFVVWRWNPLFWGKVIFSQVSVCPGGLCPGVSVWLGLSWRPPLRWKNGRYASYWNVFLSIVEFFKLKKGEGLPVYQSRKTGTIFSKIYWNLCFIPTLILKLDGCRREIALNMTLILHGNGVVIVRFSQLW